MAHSVISVPFHGSTLYIVKHQGKPYVPMKPIVDSMEMSWPGQLTKLRQKFSSTMTEIPIVTEDGNPRKIVCLPLRKLVGWLQTISPNRVQSQLRDKVILFQNECDDVLYDHWNKEEVTNPRTEKKSLPASEPLNAADMGNLMWLITMMGTRFKHKDAWNAGIWYSLRRITSTPSPQPFRVGDLPVLAQECHRIMNVTSEASSMICRFEKDVLKHVIRNRKEFDAIASQMQDDFQQLQLETEGTRRLEKFEEIGLMRLKRRLY